MSDAVLVAIITGACAVIGQWLISRKQAQNQAIAAAVRDNKIEMRLEAVERKLDEHNSYASRFESIAVDIGKIKTEVTNIKGGMLHG